MDKKRSRNFLISCGLREGYESLAPEHSLEEAREIIGKWIEERMNTGKKIVAGTLLTGDFIYPLEKAGTFTYRTEPAFKFNGHVREDASDEDAVEMLTDLAKRLASAFKQERVHVEYCSEYWVIES